VNPRLLAAYPGYPVNMEGCSSSQHVYQHIHNTAQTVSLFSQGKKSHSKFDLLRAILEGMQSFSPRKYDTFFSGQNGAVRCRNSVK
jgi:hypothetical protein